MREIVDEIATSARGRLAMTNTNTKDVGINEGGRWLLVFSGNKFNQHIGNTSDSGHRLQCILNYLLDTV